MKQILEMVARYVTDEKLLASWYLWRDAFKLMSGRFKSAELFARLVNAGGDLVCTRDTMPLGYALDAGSGPRNAYFDALEMVSQEALMRQRNLKRNGGGDYDYQGSFFQVNNKHRGDAVLDWKCAIVICQPVGCRISTASAKAASAKAIQ